MTAKAILIFLHNHRYSTGQVLMFEIFKFRHKAMQVRRNFADPYL
jgi:hypothetical protein